MYPSIEIAKCFIKKGYDEGKPVTQMQLQKLVYFANGYNLVSNGEPLINEAFEAWDYGPVCPTIYHEYKIYGANPIIPDDVVLQFLGKSKNFDLKVDVHEKNKKIIDEVWDGLKELTGLELSTITHLPNSAWSKSYRQGIRSVQIPNELIIDEMKQYIS